MARRNAAAATARLRKTFRYPSDDEDNTSLPGALDEQEQESLIASLSERNSSRNATTRYLLLALPILSTIPYILFFLPSSSSNRILGILGLSSLAATTFLIFKKSPEKTGIPILDGLTEPNVSTKSARQKRAALLSAGTEEGGDVGPLESYLPYLNMVIALLSALTGLVQGHQHNANTKGVHPVLLGALPGVIYAVVLFAKVVMASVDPERELGGLRYGYKGA
ncbi:hypothetical protein QBC35DRAFT_117572 [Podospora australis]|uniref:Uncharacterized protein n=1 Tax=Podospora australis TaxID=1536484 RepID=A0AAN7AIK4_9PEZI|nr:hypothetical protein QBC35DRAFT_117572 [Podospora australis]